MYRANTIFGPLSCHYIYGLELLSPRDTSVRQTHIVLKSVKEHWERCNIELK